MDNLEIRQRIDSIKYKLKENAATFVLDDSADLIKEWMNLQRICSHTMVNSGVSYFSFPENLVCPVCGLSREKFENK